MFKSLEEFLIPIDSVSRVVNKEVIDYNVRDLRTTFCMLLVYVVHYNFHLFSLELLGNGFHLKDVRHRKGAFSHFSQYYVMFLDSHMSEKRMIYFSFITIIFMILLEMGTFTTPIYNAISCV